ncbi:hypothetical protein SDC9_184055 [bioreactor metagenome]|uniref:Uncharacterized protein n=1 Tax=bioreactor metagenome TaxID=1076179 RepID=A0A645HDE1_9ZZZZ
MRLCLNLFQILLIVHIVVSVFVDPFDRQRRNGEGAVVGRITEHLEGKYNIVGRGLGAVTEFQIIL